MEDLVGIFNIYPPLIHCHTHPHPHPHKHTGGRDVHTQAILVQPFITQVFLIKLEASVYLHYLLCSFSGLKMEYLLLS